jgi:hypothetical protein
MSRTWRPVLRAGAEAVARRASRQGKPSNQILAAKHVIVAKIPRHGGERTAQPLRAQPSRAKSTGAPGDATGFMHTPVGYEGARRCG